MDNTVDREKELKEQFNAFFRRHHIENLYDQLSIEDFIELKKVFSCINNIITLRATLAFVDQLAKDGFISPDTCVKMRKGVNGQHANANGFDVRFDEENCEKKIIAEVKCNIPVNKSSFGAAQEEGILEDIKHLTDREGKEKGGIEDTSDYYKFMVLLDCGEDGKVKTCMRKLMEGKEHVKEYTTPNALDKDNVFVMYVKIG